jgi:penicillin-binding protein 1A
VTELKPWEAALLAGIVSSPAAYDPVSHPQAALGRRNVVLRNMLDQRYITPADYATGLADTGPPRNQIRPPTEQSVTPSAAYFTTWVKQQVVDRYGPHVAFEGGLRIRTTLDLDVQRAAEQTIANKLSDPAGPAASLVAIDNGTGEVRAMVGGRNFKASPFNLATQGQRQPGSSFKAFVLAEALKRGISPDSVWPSRKRVFTVPHGGGEKFTVRNYEGNYVGSQSLASATTFSDNSVYAAVGIQAGVGRIASLAQQMGIRTPVSHNYAITLGGLKQGVTPLDMAHAYETLAHGGQRVSGTLGAPDRGPVGIAEVQGVPGRGTDINHPLFTRVLPPSLVSTENSILQTVIDQGTGKAAAIGQFAAGKTGTTENYGDAWFVGFTHRMTVAVWVGYPDRLRSMKTDYNGSPVAGGTFPAEIWHDFMTSALAIYAQRDAAKAAQQGGASTTGTSTSPPGPSGATGSGSAGSSGGSGAGSGSAAGPSRHRGTPSAGASPTPAPRPSAPSSPGPRQGGGGGSGAGSGSPPGGAPGGGSGGGAAPPPRSGGSGGGQSPGAPAGPTGGAGAQ